jgi:hypothetical protein
MLKYSGSESLSLKLVLNSGNKMMRKEKTRDVPKATLCADYLAKLVMVRFLNYL